MINDYCYNILLYKLLSIHYVKFMLNYLLRDNTRFSRNLIAVRELKIILYKRESS